MDRRVFLGALTASTFSLLTACSSRKVYTPPKRTEKNIDRYAYRESRIMTYGRFSSRQMTSYFLTKNLTAKSESVDYIARIYIREAALEGVNHDIAFAQMCHETNFLKYGNQVQRWQHNFCGLGATDDGSRGASFPDVPTGVRAHIQHLKAYASTKSLNSRLVDPRFKYVKRGSAPTIDKLTGTWATDGNYAFHLRRHLSGMLEVYS